MTWKKITRIRYSGCDRNTYQQDIVIHRSEGISEEVLENGLRIWHIYLGEDGCNDHYTDILFSTPYLKNAPYHKLDTYTAESATFRVRLENATLSGTLSIYHNSTTKTTPSLPHDTYLFFDGFENGLHPDWIYQGTSEQIIAAPSITNISQCLEARGYRSGSWGTTYWSTSRTLEFPDHPVRIEANARSFSSEGYPGYGAVGIDDTTYVAYHANTAWHPVSIPSYHNTGTHTLKLLVYAYWHTGNWPYWWDDIIIRSSSENPPTMLSVKTSNNITRSGVSFGTANMIG